MHPGTLPRTRGRKALLGIAAATALALAAPSAAAAPETGPGPVNRAFSQAAEEFGVPRDLLVAVAFGETRLDGHDGEPSHAGGYGVMHLVSSPRRHTLEEAAELTGASGRELRHDNTANIRGGAAVLESYADRTGVSERDRDRPAAWYPAVARYGSPDDLRMGRFYADTVYGILEAGVRARTGEGERVTTPGRKVRPERGRYTDVPPPAPGPTEEPDTRGADYPPARWVPAHPGNYRAGRSAAIDTVVVHVAQGTYSGTVNWFRNPASRVSTHYVLRSSDGEVTQMVRDADTAWHARDANPRSLGIEHEGYVADATWFTDALYRASAALTAHLCDTHGIPKDRRHIVGHTEVPGNSHTDPGPHWDWDRYMELVNGG
ncbi:N-acetylmuramoyl-L-alanine amidase [Streptomyces sp. MNU89]|uniref:N-acetylmuramoyl-L-alanine amidase n=1 Tax=Streptomyces sp. MNU89 TaxID=2560025 RepID=UPI001E4B0873|nr:N-acetylmuramoyl-L-alanine amidase [Streptomyces sp. MNU89]MCC9737827.1 N-acetylmuramoyl-L-alanine amidase [Streptomyces sp. MNU89]